MLKALALLNNTLRIRPEPCRKLRYWVYPLHMPTEWLCYASLIVSSSLRRIQLHPTTKFVVYSIAGLLLTGVILITLGLLLVMAGSDPSPDAVKGASSFWLLLAIPIGFVNILILCTRLGIAAGRSFASTKYPLVTAFSFVFGSGVVFISLYRFSQCYWPQIYSFRDFLAILWAWFAFSAFCRITPKSESLASNHEDA